MATEPSSNAKTASIATSAGVIVQSSTVPPPSDITDAGERAKAVTVAQAQITAGDEADAQETIQTAGVPAELVAELERRAREIPQSNAAVQRDVADSLGQLAQVVKVVVPGGTATGGAPASAADIQRQTLEAFGLANAPTGQAEPDAAARPVETTTSPEGQPAQTATATDGTRRRAK